MRSILKPSILFIGKNKGLATALAQVLCSRGASVTFDDPETDTLTRLSDDGRDKTVKHHPWRPGATPVDQIFLIIDPPPHTAHDERLMGRTMRIYDMWEELQYRARHPVQAVYLALHAPEGSPMNLPITRIESDKRMAQAEQFKILGHTIAETLPGSRVTLAHVDTDLPYTEGATPSAYDHAVAEACLRLVDAQAALKEGEAFRYFCVFRRPDGTPPVQQG